MITFGPSLIGQTEKTLNALLERCLDGTGLSEPEWVTLRIADHLTIAGSDDDLASAVASRAHRLDATQLVANLSARGLITDDRTSTTGRTIVDAIQGRVVAMTTPLWADFDPGDMRTTERVLNTVLNRAREVLALPPLDPRPKPAEPSRR